MAPKKRKAESTESGRAAQKAKQSAQMFKVAPVVIYKSFHEYERFKSKVITAGCIFILDSPFDCAFTYEIPAGINNPLACEQKPGDIEVHTSKSARKIEGYDVDPSTSED